MSDSFVVAASTRTLDASPAPPTSFVDAFESNVQCLAASRLFTWLHSDLSEAATLTYAEARQQALTLCCALKLRWRMAHGARVMLLHPPGLDLIVAFIGCQYAHTIAVPYYPPRLPTSPVPSKLALRQFADGLGKLQRVCSSAEPSLFLTTRAYLRLSYVSSLVLAPRGKQYAWPSEWTWQSSSDLSPPLHDEARWLETEWLPSRLGTAAAPDEISFLQYTSGSTGAPKGVAVATTSLVANIHSVKQASECSRAGRVGDAIALVSWLPQYHDMGLIGGCLSPAALGWRADLMEPSAFLTRPAAWLEAISRLHGTHDVISPAPNFGYALCARRVTAEDASTLKLSHWRMAMNGAEVIRHRTLRAFEQRFGGANGFSPGAWACVYGLAENCLYACGSAEAPVVVSLDRRHVGVGGRPLMAQEGGIGVEGDTRTDGGIGGDGSDDQRVQCVGCRVLDAGAVRQSVRIVHPETCDEMADGSVGEVWLSGESICRGYWNLPAETQHAFGAALSTAGRGGGGGGGGRGGGSGGGGGGGGGGGCYLRSGDLGFLHQSRLYICGRLKDILTLRGRTLHARYPPPVTAPSPCTSPMGGAQSFCTHCNPIHPRSRTTADPAALTRDS